MIFFLSNKTNNSPSLVAMLQRMQTASKLESLPSAILIPAKNFRPVHVVVFFSLLFSQFFRCRTKTLARNRNAGSTSTLVFFSPFLYLIPILLFILLFTTQTSFWAFRRHTRRTEFSALGRRASHTTKNHMQPTPRSFDTAIIEASARSAMLKRTNDADAAMQIEWEQSFLADHAETTDNRDAAVTLPRRACAPSSARARVDARAPLLRRLSAGSATSGTFLPTGFPAPGFRRENVRE